MAMSEDHSPAPTEVYDLPEEINDEPEIGSAVVNKSAVCNGRLVLTSPAAAGARTPAPQNCQHDECRTELLATSDVDIVEAVNQMPENNLEIAAGGHVGSVNEDLSESLAEAPNTKCRTMSQSMEHSPIAAMDAIPIETLKETPNMEIGISVPITNVAAGTAGQQTEEAPSNNAEVLENEGPLAPTCINQGSPLEPPPLGVPTVFQFDCTRDETKFYIPMAVARKLCKETLGLKGLENLQ